MPSFNLSTSVASDSPLCHGPQKWAREYPFFTSSVHVKGMAGLEDIKNTARFMLACRDDWCLPFLVLAG